MKASPMLMVVEECLYKKVLVKTPISKEVLVKKTAVKNIVRPKKIQNVKPKKMIRNTAHHTLHTPSLIKNIHSQAIKKQPLKALSPAFSYEERIASIMQHALKLPNYGEVKVTITLHCSGKVTDITVLCSQNNENKSYLLESIPTLSFPPFEEGESKSFETFTFNFFNS